MDNFFLEGLHNTTPGYKKKKLTITESILLKLTCPSVVNLGVDTSTTGSEVHSLGVDTPVIILNKISFH